MASAIVVPNLTPSRQVAKYFLIKIVFLVFLVFKIKERWLDSIVFIVLIVFLLLRFRRWTRFGWNMQTIARKLVGFCGMIVLNE